MLITSKQNPKIKYLAKLQMKKYRDKEQKFLVEGFYPVEFALRNNYPLLEIFICPELFIDKFDNQKLIEEIKRKNIELTEVSKSVFSKITNYQSPEGLLAVAPQKHSYLTQHQPVKNGLYLVGESIEKLTSLGNLYRLADNAGVDALILCNMRADMFNPQAIRTSLGTFFSINILESTTNEALKWFKGHKIKTIATSPGATTDYTQVDLTGPVAIIIGTEHGGLSANWLDQSDVNVKIPMFGQTNSLSVTASAAVMLYEAIRQHR